MSEAQDEADLHDMRIHRAKQLARPVMYQGRERFIAGFCWHPSDREMVVYLTGSHEAVRPNELILKEQ